MGILDFVFGIEEIYEESQQVFLVFGYLQDGQVVFYKISVDCGLKWEDVVVKLLELMGFYDGFYFFYKVCGNKFSCLLVEQNCGQFFMVYKFNIGWQSQLEVLDSFCCKFYWVIVEEVKEFWESGYILLLMYCSYSVWNWYCWLVQEGKDCLQGLWLWYYYMLCGVLLCVWGCIVVVMVDVSSSSYLQIVWLKIKDRKK